MLCAETPAKLQFTADGSKVKFAVATVNDAAVYNQKDQDDTVVAATINTKTVPTVKSVTPSDVEVNVSTVVIKFSNYSDYLGCLTDKNIVRQKIQDIRKKLNELVDFPANDPEIVDLNQRIDWLKSYAKTL